MRTPDIKWTNDSIDIMTTKVSMDLCLSISLPAGLVVFQLEISGIGKSAEGKEETYFVTLDLVIDFR